jgi:hypothetical protein
VGAVPAVRRFGRKGSEDRGKCARRDASSKAKTREREEEKKDFLNRPKRQIREDRIKMASCVSEEKEYDNPAVAFSGTPGPPIEPPEQVLGEEADSVIRQLNLQIDTTIFRLLTAARTAEEFDSIRKELFPKYRNLAGAVAGIIRGDIGDIGLSDLLSVCFAELSNEFASDQTLFSSDDGGREEALFCLDGLMRSHFLLCQIADTSAPSHVAEHDARLIQQTLGRIWWSQMHLRCLVFAMKENASLPARAVLREILSGFRVAIMAYASAREAWGLRFEAIEGISNLNSSFVREDDENSLLSEAEYDLHFIETREQNQSAGSAG